MSEAPLRYAVLLRDPAQLSPMALAKALAKLRGIPVHDAVPGARAAWGILAEDLDAAAAKRLAEGLSAGGLGALPVPAGLIEDLPEAEKLGALPFSPEGLFPENPPGKVLRVPWENVAVIAAGGFTERSVKKVKTEEGPSVAQKALNIGLTLATGLPMGLGGGKKEVEKTVETSDLVFHLDLHLRSPARRLRIDAQDFDYSCLKELKGYAVLVNFRTLVSELGRRAPKARRSRGAAALIESRPLREMGYESMADLERESRWLLTLEALGGGPPPA